MRTITFITALMLAAAPAAMAQNSSGGNGDSPQNRGSTGWTGAHPETGGATQDGSQGNANAQAKPPAATTGQAVQVHDEAEAKDQPAMASGEDLNGPPQHFAPSKTPE